MVDQPERDPFEVIAEGLQSVELVSQLQASKDLLSVSNQLGPSRTQSDLIPLLDHYCFPEEFCGPLGKAEVVAQIAKQLDENILVAIGGPLPWIHFVLPLLERLCTLEESIIRQNTVEAWRTCFQHLTPEQVSSSVFPCHQRLSSTEHFPGKVSAGMLTGEILSKVKEYSLSTEQSNELKRTHLQLTTDETPLVRFTAFKHLSDLFRVADHNFYLQHGEGLLRTVFEQVPTSHRRLLVEILKTLLECALTKPHDIQLQLEHVVLPWLETCAEDESWRIRLELVTKLPQICKCFSDLNRQAPASALILPWILALLTDTDSTVRENMLKRLSDCLRLLICTGFENEILTCLFQLSSDNVEKIRELTVTAVIDCFEIIEYDKGQLVEYINRVKTDENPDVLRNICNLLGRITGILGEDYRHILEQYAEKWHTDPKWRVRFGVASNISTIARHYGATSFNQSIFKTILVKNFVDTAFRIRSEACIQMKLLCDIFTVAYVEEEILPHVLASFDHTRNYLHRLVAFDAAVQLKDTLDSDTFQVHFIPLILRGLQDEIVNVRISACTTITKLTVQLLESDFLSSIITSVNSLLADEDPDVKYFCQKAIESLQLVES